METILDVKNTNFHPALKDVENMFWFFFLSIRTLSDDDIRNFLKKKNDMQEGYASFNEMLDKFDKATDLQIEQEQGSTTSRLNILPKMIFTGRAIVILVYEFLFSSNYLSKIKESHEFIFLKHIRNGAAHNNRFDFIYKYGSKKGEWALTETEKIEWNGLVINRDLQDKVIFNDFISLVQVFLLAKHFSDRLTLIDSKTI